MDTTGGRGAAEGKDLGSTEKALKLQLQEIRTHKPSLLPQVILIDGNGILHPRGCGVASHIGVVTDLPTIGVAKNLICFDGLSRDKVRGGGGGGGGGQAAGRGEACQARRSHGMLFLCYSALKSLATQELVGTSGRVHGAAMIGRTGVFVQSSHLS
eukprot:755883-Hanusia_phi.AAC.3